MDNFAEKWMKWMKKRKNVPALVKMMGYLGMGNNPMEGATVAVAMEQAMKRGER